MPALLTPDSGLLFWMALSFIVMFVILAKYGFPVITKMVDDRKRYIDESLLKAREANEKLANIRQESEQIIREAREQQAKILREASETSQQIIKDAKAQAQIEGSKMLSNAKEQINAEKDLAMREIKSQLVALSTDIAKKVLQKDLDEQSKQLDYIDTLLDNLNK
jgi:F-type H+-transporting ATPase subunit b